VAQRFSAAIGNFHRMRALDSEVPQRLKPLGVSLLIAALKRCAIQMQKLMFVLAVPVVLLILYCSRFFP
jgi:hypothetical protein